LTAGLVGNRHQAWGTLASFPAVAAALTALGTRGRAKITSGLAAIAALTGLAFIAVDWRGYSPGTGVLELAVPVRAVALADSLRLDGPILNTPWYGGYILWVRGERHPPLVDTRNLGGAPFQRLLSRAFNDTAGFDSLDAQWHFTHAVVQPLGDSPDRLALQLASRPEWTLIFADDAGLLYVRRDREPELAIRLGYSYLTPDYRVMAERSSAALHDPRLEQRLRAELERARAASPWHARASLWLALLDLARGRTREALSGLDEVERLAPLTPGLALRQGMAREQAGDLVGARAAYRRAVREREDAATAREALRRIE
jgi:hypothetical protein